MCCLYYFDNDTIADVEHLTGGLVSNRFDGDVHPTDRAVIITGFYNYFDADDRFIIPTTEANKSMKKVHDRMPLILPENQIKDWIYEDDIVKDILEQGSPILPKYQEYEQLTLW